MSASRNSWTCLPWTDGAALPGSIMLSAADAATLQQGCIPRSMDDKWFVYFEAPHLYLHRSWTGTPVYRLTLTPTTAGVEVHDARWAAAEPDPPAQRLAHEARALGYLIQTLLEVARRRRR